MGVPTGMIAIAKSLVSASAARVRRHSITRGGVTGRPRHVVTRVQDASTARSNALVGVEAQPTNEKAAVALRGTEVFGCGLILHGCRREGGTAHTQAHGRQLRISVSDRYTRLLAPPHTHHQCTPSPERTYSTAS